MNKVAYYNYIEEKLNLLSVRVSRNGKLNHLELHSHSENFYEQLLNMLYGWKLINLNSKLQNVEAIDLADSTNKLIVQVSATDTKNKIENSLDKKSLSSYLGYSFKFVLIPSKDAGALKTKTYNNPYNLVFDPKQDIIDVSSILWWLNSQDAKILKQVYLFIKSELGNDVDIAKLESNLATIIKILSRENLDLIDNPNVNSFEIDRKITFNKLDSAKDVVNDYAAHHPTVDKIYNEFDQQGKNKSFSVLAKIRSLYIKNQNNKSDDELFFYIIDEIVKIVTNSTNYVEIPIDELELCANILAVDAFVRCKIFKNPTKYKYANTR